MELIRWTEEKIAEHEASGYGRGSGAQYRPWLAVGDVPYGQTYRAWSQKTGRTHHLLSSAELAVFRAAENDLAVVDIFEQYPLDRDVAREVAKELGIPHPRYPGTQVDAVVLVDFLLTLKGEQGKKQTAVSVIRCDRPASARERQLIALRQAYFMRYGVPHHLVRADSLPKRPVQSLEWLRDPACRKKQA